MRLGIITDIHNNIVALRAILERLKKEECDAIACLGDIVGIGPFPEETVNQIREIQNLVICVRGNHERYVDHIPSHLGKKEKEYHRWEHSLLSEQSKEFLSSLPYRQTIELGGRSIYAAHYSLNEANKCVNFRDNPSQEQLEKMFLEVDASIILYGHDHKGSVEAFDRFYINCGSLGCPEKEMDIARAGVLDIEPNGVVFTHITEKYDVGIVLWEMEKRNMPAIEEIKAKFFGLERQKDGEKSCSKA